MKMISKYDSQGERGHCLTTSIPLAQGQIHTNKCWAFRQVFSLSVVRSCHPSGTSTSLSLPCSYMNVGYVSYGLLLFSHSAVSYSLLPDGLQHARLPCPSLSPRVCLNSCPLCRWCHPTISSSALSFSQHQSLFQWDGSLHQAAKVLSFSFSISPSNEYSGLISFRIDWFDLFAVQGTLKSLLQHHILKASVLQHSAVFSPSFT